MWRINMAMNASTAGLTAPESTNRYPEHGKAAAAVRKVPRLYTRCTEQGALTATGLSARRRELKSIRSPVKWTSLQPKTSESRMVSQVLDGQALHITT
ncbi:hypothetical protein AOLI_G00103890 [Acnodon oligacanthus]